MQVESGCPQGHTGISIWRPLYIYMCRILLKSRFWWPEHWLKAKLWGSGANMTLNVHSQLGLSVNSNHFGVLATWKHHIFAVDDGIQLVHALFFLPIRPFLSSVFPCYLPYFVPTHGDYRIQDPSTHLKFYWPFRLWHAQNSTSRFDSGAGVEKLFYLFLEHYIYISILQYSPVIIWLLQTFMLT